MTRVLQHGTLGRVGTRFRDEGGIWCQDLNMPCFEGSPSLTEPGHRQPQVLSHVQGPSLGHALHTKVDVPHRESSCQGLHMDMSHGGRV